MGGLLKRLVAGGMAYQAASLLSAALAVVTLRLYSSALSPTEYGYGETLLTAIILVSIFLRLGLGEAFVRFYVEEEDVAERERLARTTTTVVAAVTTVVGLLLLLVAGPLSELLLDTRDATLLSLGLLGLWAFTNLEVAYALLRVEEQRARYLVASVGNVLLTVGLTVLFVVVLGFGARGYVLGNYGASSVVLVGLWAVQGRRVAPLRPRRLRALLAYGAPTIAADATVFALNVVDRSYLLHARSAGAAGVYAVAVKLATAIVVVVRGFQAAWPPLVYGLRDDEEARRLYAFVALLYVAVIGWAVCGLALLAPWVVTLLADPKYRGADAAVGWIALGWALYGLYLLLVTIAGRVRAMGRTLLPAALGLLVNVVVLVLLVPPLGVAGAGIALAAAYVVMLAALHALTRRIFHVPFDWPRLAAIVALMALDVAGAELLLGRDGLGALALRCLWLLAVPAGILALLSPEERARVRGIVRAARLRRAKSG